MSLTKLIKRKKKINLYEFIKTRKIYCKFNIYIFLGECKFKNVNVLTTIYIRIIDKFDLF